MEEDQENTDQMTTRNEVQESKDKSDKHTSKSERKKKMKKLKEENKRLKKLLKQIGGKVSNSGLLSVEQQNALAEEIRHEISCISDDNHDTDQNKELLNEKASNDVPLKSLDDEKSETSFYPSNFVAGPTNLDGNNGFQFGLCQPSADVSSSVKQNIGKNYFLREVVVNPQVAEYMDFAACELNVLRQQVCLKNEDFAPISPLPPTPPPKSSDSKPTEIQRTERTIAHPETNHIPLNHNQPKQSFEPSSSKKHSFNHQQSEGFDVTTEQPIRRTGEFTGAYDGLFPASNASNSRLGKYEFTSKRSADGGVLLTFSLSDNISVSLDSNTWEITCHIPDPKRKLLECSPMKLEPPSPPHNSNVDSISNDLEVHEPVPYKKLKLSSSEESLRIVLPSMEGVELGKMDEPESRGLLTQGVPNLVPKNEVSQPNILSTQSEKNDQSKQDKISSLLSVNHNNENQFQAAEDNRSIVSSSSESTSPAQLCAKKLRCTAMATDTDNSSVQGRLNSNCSVVKTEEMLITCPNSHGLNAETSNFKNMHGITKSQISVGVSTSESDNPSERSSTKYSLKKLRKRNASSFSKENLSMPVLFSTVNGTENFGDKNGYLSTSCSESSVFKKPKRMSKKQRLTSSYSIQVVDSTACKSAKMREREVKADKNSSKVLRKQNLGFEDADCSVNPEESDFKIKGSIKSEPQISETNDSDNDKTKLNQINMQSPTKIGKSTAQITRQKNISISRIEDEQNLIETSLQNDIKNTEASIKMHNENNRETLTLENRLSFNQGTKLNDDCDQDASSSILSGTLSTIAKCENFELPVLSHMKCEILHEDEAEDNSYSKTVANNSERIEGSMPQNLTHSTLKIENDTINSLEESKSCVKHIEFECNIKSSSKCKSEPTSDQSDVYSDAETDNTTTSNMYNANNYFMSPSKDIKPILSELVSPNSKIDKKFLSPKNKLSSNDFIQDIHEENLNEMHLNQIELGSFDPDAFTKPNIDELGKTISGSRTEMMLSTTTSKNLLKDDIFSVFNSDNSLKIALKTQDENKKESSSTEFSFLNSNAFPFDCFSLPIKKRILPEVEQSESTYNSERVPSSPVKTQNTGNAKCITPPKASMVENDQLLIKGDLNTVSSNSTLSDLEVGEVEIEVKTEYFKKRCTKKSVSKRSPGYLLEHINEKEINKISDSPEKVLNGSTSKSIQRSLFLNSECKNNYSEGTENESDSEHALVIADDAVGSDHATEPEMNIPEDVLHFTSSACVKVSPKKRRRRQFSGTKKNNEFTTVAESSCVDVILTGIEVAFKTLEKMKYNDMHVKHNTHNLYSAFINPDNSLECIVHLIIKNLSVSKRNPMLSYFLNRDSSLLLPLPENCIVTALFKSSIKPRLVKLLPSVVLTIYDIVFAKQKLHIYGLCSLCRVLTEICKRNKNKKVPISLCCDLVSIQHKFAPYMIASIAGVWKDLFAVSEQSPVEDRVLYGVLALAVHNRTKFLTQSQWNHCNVILSETLTVKLQPDLHYTIKFIEKMINMKCSKGIFANTFRLTMSLVIIARIQDWQSTKELVLDSFVIPSLQKFSSEEMNEKAFTLFCSLYGSICASCPYTEEPKDLLTSMFENKADTFVQEVAAIALIKLCLETKEAFPDDLAMWVSQNSESSKLECLKDTFRRHLISDTEISETDVHLCD